MIHEDWCPGTIRTQTKFLAYVAHVFFGLTSGSRHRHRGSSFDRAPIMPVQEVNLPPTDYLAVDLVRTQAM